MPQPKDLRLPSLPPEINCHPERRHAQPHRACRSRRTCVCPSSTQNHIVILSEGMRSPIAHAAAEGPASALAPPRNHIVILSEGTRSLTAHAAVEGPASALANPKSNCHPERRHAQPHRACRSRRTCVCPRSTQNEIVILSEGMRSLTAHAAAEGPASALPQPKMKLSS